jgi:hypothetical protein
VEVLRLYRSDICEMDVRDLRADRARMAKRSWTRRVERRSVAAWAWARTRLLQPHLLLLSKSGGLQIAFRLD